MPQKKLLSELLWMEQFRTNEAGHILAKTKFEKGDRVGCYNPLGQIIYIDKNTPVIPLDCRVSATEFNTTGNE